MANERLSLETPEDSEEQSKRGIKLDATKSMFARKAKNEEEFDKRADEANEEINDRKIRAVELVKQFWSTVQNKTLLNNKGPLQKSLEKEMLNNLLKLAAEMNNDDKEPESAGSVAMITLLFKTVLYQRDQFNELGYKIDQLERKFSKLSSAPSTDDVSK